MDVMQIRRMIMQMIGGGGDMGLWKQKNITATQAYSTNISIKDWIDGIMQNVASDFFVYKDNPIYAGNVFNNEFVAYICIGDTHYSNGAFYIRTRSTTLQNRGFSSTEEAYIQSGDTFTIFYQ